MDDYKKRELTAINIQIIASFASILTIIISIILLYNEKKDIKDEETIFTPEQTQKISVFNRQVLLLIAVIFLIVNYELYDISKKQGENLKPYSLQIVASYLTILASIITLYVVQNPEDTGEVVDVENPII